MYSRSYGYWVKGDKIIDVTDTTHIDFIIKHPALFGLTKEEIDNVYKLYNEKVGVEGKAREEIILRALRNGWLRIRHYTKGTDYWSIQFDKFSSREKSVKEFVQWAVLESKVMPPTDTLVLIGHDDGYYKLYAFRQGGANTFLKENKKQNINFKLIEWREYNERY